jgi:hypothetical protein
MTVVAAIVRADLNLTPDTTVTNTTVTFSLETGPMTITHVRTFSDATVGSRKPRLAHARSVVAVAVDALTAELGSTIWACPSRLAMTNSIHTLATQIAIGRTVLVCTLLAKETR